MNDSTNHLKGKTALVTGASSGLGYAVAELLVSAGAKVFGLCRHTSAVPEGVTAIACDPVSYTHLTLPTIYSV